MNVEASLTRRTALLVFLLTLAAFNLPLVYDLAHKPFFTWTTGQDFVPTALLPIRVLGHGDFTLDEFRQFIQENWRSPYFVAAVNGKLVSRTSVVGAVLALPFYGIPLGSGWIVHTGKDWLVYPWSAFFPSKFTAAFLTAITVVMFFFCVRELLDRRTSAWLAIAFGLGTSIWSTAAEGLWTDTTSVLFQTIALWFLLRARRAGATATAPAGLFFSAATIARPSNAIAALVFTLYILVEYRVAFWRWVLWAIPPVLPALIYNATYNGSAFVFGYQDDIAQYLTLPKLDGILGLLISPSRGLFVYSPFLIFALWGLWLSRNEKERWLYWASAAVIAIYVGMLILLLWDGGWGYGTRMMVDVMPYWVLLLLPAFARLNQGWRRAFWAMVGYGIVLQSFGLWDYGVRWHWHWNNWEYNVWDVAENEPLFYFKQYAELAQHYLTTYLWRR